jgi:hypothetical protein
MREELKEDYWWTIYAPDAVAVGKARVAVHRKCVPVSIGTVLGATAWSERAGTAITFRSL